MLRIPPEPLSEVQAAVVAGYPQEVCGLLVGSMRNGVNAVQRIVQARNLNLDRARDRYELDPEDYLRADQAARADGLEVVGIWHSHPDHVAVPSETDRAAAWESWSYLIAQVSRDGITELRSWRLRDDQFVEEDLER